MITNVECETNCNGKSEFQEKDQLLVTEAAHVSSEKILHIGINNGHSVPLGQNNCDIHVKEEPHHSYMCCSTRMAIAIVTFCVSINFYTQRVNISVAMVCMVNDTGRINSKATFFLEDNSTIISHLNNEAISPVNATQNHGEFNWSKPIQGHILAAYFWGNIITLIPGGWLSLRFGSRLVIGISLLTGAIVTLLCPLAARLHYGILIGLRVLLGLLHGTFFPALHNLWSNWSPPEERSRLIGVGFAGSHIGSIVLMPLSSVLCEYAPDNGWPWIFYVFGFLGIIWFFIWMIVVTNAPSNHPRVTEEEKLFIETSLAGNRKQSSSIPWRSIMTSLPFWSIIITHVCSNWGVYSFLTFMPTFVNVLGFDVKYNGIITCLPYIGSWIMLTASSTLADCLISGRVVSITWTRKIFNTTGLVVPIIFLIGLANLQQHQSILTVVALILYQSFTGILFGAGCFVNHADIAPPFAGLLYAISNFCATVPGFLSPIIIGLLTENHSGWQSVFYLTSGFYGVGALTYLLTGSGEVQPWAKELFDEHEIEEEIEDHDNNV